MALSFCEAFDGNSVVAAAFATILGGVLVDKIGDTTPDKPTFTAAAPAEVPADASALCSTDGGSYDSTAGGGGGGDGGEPGDGAP